MTITIPVGPDARRLRFLFDTTSGATPSSGVDQYWDGDINWVTPEDLGKLPDRYVRETRRRITEDGYKNCGVSLASSGSIVLSKRAPIGQTAILAVPATCNQGCFLLTKVDGVDERFYYYALIYLRPALEALGRGSTFMELSGDDLRSVALPFPSEERQRLIANYLDRETARIDGLIAEKQHMLALLEEKRAALISRVVTRGLDHNAPLKPSGQEWLGDIPAHWEIWKLKYVVSKIGSGVTPRGGAESYQSEGIPLLRSQNIHFDGLRMDDVVFVDAEMHESMENSKVQDGDVLLNITGASIGRCFYIENMNGEVNVNQHVCIVRPSSQIQTKFLYFTLRSNIGQTQIDLSQSGSGREGLNFEALGNFSMPVPSVNEQIAITEYLEATGQRSHLLLSEVRNSIDRLKERRAALITAAVTGQIPLNEMQNLTKEPSCASIV